MTKEEAKEIFLNRGYVQVKGGRIYDGDKWRESVVVISKWLEQEPCEDVISRADMLDAVGHGTTYTSEEVQDIVNSLPSVTPKQKGHWKFIQRGKFIDICCSECGYVSVKDYAYNYTIDQLDEQEKKEFFAESHMNFCECCGTKMLEPQESEDKV